MKDLPHHVKQLNRKVIRSERRESEKETEIEQKLLEEKTKFEETKGQARKKAKLSQKKKSESHIPHPQTPEERNKLMNKRVPIFRERYPKTPNQRSPK